MNEQTNRPRAYTQEQNLTLLLFPPLLFTAPAILSTGQSISVVEKEESLRTYFRRLSAELICLSGVKPVRDLKIKAFT